MHSFHTGVHRVCTAGDGFCTGPAPRRTPIGISAGRGPIRAAQRAVRRSVDHRGRPTRRDPDVRRGATATLTASSTARQRLGDPDRRVGPRSVRRAATASCVGGWTMGGRDPPGHRRLPVLGYAGRSLWTVPSAVAWSGVRPRGYASAAGSRGSWTGDGCSAGTCACSRGTPTADDVGAARARSDPARMGTDRSSARGPPDRLRNPRLVCRALDPGRTPQWGRAPGPVHRLRPA